MTTMMVAALAVSAATTIATQVMQHQAQKRAANDAAEAQRNQVLHDQQVAKNQYAAYQDAANRLNLRDSQERESAAQEAFNAKLQTMRNRERARAASSGVAGISVDALLGDFDAAGARQQNTITANLNASLDQNAAERRAAFSPVQSAFLQANRKQRTIRGPSPMALGLGIASTVASTTAEAYTSGLFPSGGGGVTAS
ncbi:MAG: hypothetical protein GEU78_10280 [Actinobacteria bacterium]|nr:hypothetical protein [Actinomycetota bacterium]